MMAVLRGERDALKAKGAKCCSSSMQRVHDILEGQALPRGSAISLELDKLRRSQAFAASAAAGPLLDAWDELGQDTRDDPLLADVAAKVGALRGAMEG
jgi:hypothetical protein